MASRLDFSQIRSLYVGTSSSTQVGTDNLVVAGNVGIGTTSPAFTSGDGLEIQRSSATATLRLDSGVFATELRAYTDGTFLGQLSNGYLDLGTDNLTKVRITGAGNVLIGTTTDNGRKLNVNGDIFSNGEIYSNQYAAGRYIRYNWNTTSFAVGGGTGIRWVIGRIYWNQVHWGGYSGMDIEIVWNYYNGARKKYSITNGANGGTVYLRESQSYASTHVRVSLGSAVDTGTTSGGYSNYYQDVYLDVNEYNQVSVNGELKGPTISIDKTSIGGSEYGWATFFSSPSASNISTFTSTAATILSSEGNWGYIDNKLGINVANPAVQLEIYNAGGPELKLSAGGSGTGGLRIIKGDSGTAYINNNDAVGMNFQIQGSDKMVIAANGNVGINATNPTAKLDVEGTWKLGDISGGSFKSYTFGTQLDVSGITSGGWARAHKISTSDSSGNVFFGAAGNNTTLTRAYWTIGDPASIDVTGYNSSNGVILLKNGNVGIGTTAPESLLHLSQASTGGDGAFLFIDNPASSTLGNTAGIRFATNAGASFSGYGSFIQAVNTNAGNGAESLTFGTWNGVSRGERMRILDNGDVGIGTAAPAFKFNVVTNAVAGRQNLAAIDRTTQNFVTFTNPQYSVDASMGLMLRVFPQSDSRQGAGIIASGGALNGETDLSLFVSSGTGSSVSYGALNIKGVSGNVGIGTTAPQKLLHINGGSGNVDNLVLESAYVSSGVGVAMQFNRSGGVLSRIRGIDEGGWNGGLLFEVRNGAASNPGYDGATNVAMKIATNGNVGINTTNPTEKLDVAGNGKLQGNLYLTATDPYIEGSGSGAMRIKHTAGQVMYIRPDQAGNVVFFEGASGQTVYMATATPSVNSTQNSSSTLIFETRARNAGGTLNIKSTSLQNTVYDIASNLSRFSITGQNVLYLDGNVGVGTNTPLSRLHTKGEIRIEDATDTTTRDYVLKTETTGALSFSDSVSGERMRIDYTGKVGINTTAPGGLLGLGVQTSVQGTNGITLGVNDNNIEFVHATFGNGFGSKFYSADSGSGVTSLRIAGRGNSTSWSDLVTILVTDTASTRGNVGIGTTSPTEKLHVDGSVVVTYNNSYQGINSVGNKAILARVSPTTGIINYAEYATAANLNGFVMGSTDARVKGNIATDSLEFITNGSTQVTVLSNGNVGIANTNPSEKLSVTGNIRMDNGAADGPQLVFGSSGFSDWNIDNFSGSLRAYYGSTEYTRLTSSGNFGIGVSPSYKLDVAGDTRITSGSLGVGVVPNATDGRIDASNDIVAYSSSDRRLKENITPIANALDKVKSLTGVEFDWKPEHKEAHGYEGHDTGVIAQEVQEVMPTAVRTNDTGYLAVRYEKLIGLLIEANKELAARVEELEKKLK